MRDPWFSEEKEGLGDAVASPDSVALVSTVVAVVAVVFMVVLTMCTGPVSLLDYIAIISLPLLTSLASTLGMDLDYFKMAELYVIMVVLSFIGWESWFSIGLEGGKSVMERDPTIGTSAAWNALINSLLDGAVALIQVMIAYGTFGEGILKTWSWDAFALMAAVGLLQNGVVSMLWSGRRGTGAHSPHDSCEFSWAPAAPFQTNAPFLFDSISAASMEPWIIQPFVLYFVALHL